MRWPVALSRFPVGSSAKRILGELANARAIATRCCSPPESWVGKWWPRPASPTRSMRSVARSAAPPVPLSSSGTCTFSSAVSVGISWKLWNTKPTFSPRSLARSFSDSFPRSDSSRSTVPRVGVSRPARRPRRVVLPLPEGPTIATKAPCGIVNVTSRSTASFCSPLMYSLVTSRAISMNEFVFWPVRHRGRVIFVAALACIVGCGSDGNLDNSRKSRETKNNMSVSNGAGPTRASDSGAKSIRTPVVLFFGTSLTAGLGLDPEQAYPSLIEKKAQAEGIPIKVVNAGLSGETTAGALRRIDWVLRTPTDLVVIEAGANDALRGLSPEDARANLEQLIAAVRAKQPLTKIALIQMEAPPNYGVAYTRSFRAIYGEVAAKEKVALLPFLLDGVAGIPRLNQPDGVHPNLTGERIVADNVWKALKPEVAKLDRGPKAG